MSKVLLKEKIAEEVYRIKIEAPLIASERKPGQFVIVQVNTDFGERIPLTIADADSEEGSITLIFQTVGKTTHLLANKEKGGKIENVLGPLGNPTHIEKYGYVVCVGGGIGAAPLYPIVEGMKKAGNDIKIILGARTKDLLILEEEMSRYADKLIICTDDGSYGRKALVTEPLKELCEEEPKPDLVVAIGPPIMMKFASETTRPFNIPTVVSLNTIMVDGTGMCGGCRVTIDGETKFVCVDGPEFDGHLVDFENMMKRIGSYRSFEQREHDEYHRCRLDEQAETMREKR
jgi:ferredoxin/flavodoxin---NADP+ reductase